MEAVKNLRFTEKEMDLIKNTFDNMDLLKTIRKVFLQMPLSAIDQSIISLNLKEKPVLEVLRKVFLPTLDPDAPIHQIIDLWLSIDIKSAIPDEAIHHIVSRKKVINYLDQQLKVLEEKGKEKIKFNEMLDIPSEDELLTNFVVAEIYTNFIARNTIIIHIEQMLSQLNILAHQKTDEQREEDRKKDSTK